MLNFLFQIGDFRQSPVKEKYFNLIFMLVRILWI